MEGGPGGHCKLAAPQRVLVGSGHLAPTPKASRPPPTRAGPHRQDVVCLWATETRGFSEPGRDQETDDDDDGEQVQLPELPSGLRAAGVGGRGLERGDLCNSSG